MKKLPRIRMKKYPLITLPISYTKTIFYIRTTEDTIMHNEIQRKILDTRKSLFALQRLHVSAKPFFSEPELQ